MAAKPAVSNTTVEGSGTTAVAPALGPNVVTNPLPRVKAGPPKSRPVGDNFVRPRITRVHGRQRSARCVSEEIERVLQKNLRAWLSIKADSANRKRRREQRGCVHLLEPGVAT